GAREDRAVGRRVGHDVHAHLADGGVGLDVVAAVGHGHVDGAGVGLGLDPPRGALDVERDVAGGGARLDAVAVQAAGVDGAGGRVQRHGAGDVVDGDVAGRGAGVDVRGGAAHVDGAGIAVGDDGHVLGGAHAHARLAPGHEP